MVLLSDSVSPFPNLSSSECPTSGLPQGGKPAQTLGKPSNSGPAPWRRKAKRISESKLHGTVKCNPAALLMRASASSRVVGLSHRVVHDERQTRRSYEQDPSWPLKVPSELGHAVRRSATECRGRRCRPLRLYKEGQPVCDVQQRIVDQAKAQGNAWDTGVVPGHPCDGAEFHVLMK
jgi:hypothetical protein